MYFLNMLLMEKTFALLQNPHEEETFNRSRTVGLGLQGRERMLQERFWLVNCFAVSCGLLLEVLK